MNNSFSMGAERTGDISITVRSLRAQNNGAEISVTVTIGNGENSETRTLVLTVAQYYDLKPRKGEITEEEFERLEKASELCAAMRCGEHLLSYAPNSVQTLAGKIARHGFSRETSNAAAARLQEMGLVNEREHMRRETEKCLRKLWGSSRIRTHLWGKGFAKETLAELPDLLEEIDFAENCAALIRKHYGSVPADRDDLRRMTAALYRYGYSMEEIRRALRMV